MSKQQAIDREDRFVSALLEGKTQRDAYIIISPAAAKWKTYSIDIKASLMAARPRVKELLAQRRREVAEVSILKASDILEETRRIALSTPGGIIDHATGRVKLPHELDAATAAAVSSFEIDDLGRIKYKFWDKNASLERAAKLLGLFREDNEQSRTTVLVDRIELVPLRALSGKK